MDAISIMIFGIATFGNVAILKWKLERERYADAGLDAGILISLAYIFGSTVTGLAIATIASMMISLYLMISPPDKLIARAMKQQKKKKKKKKRKKVQLLFL